MSSGKSSGVFLDFGPILTEWEADFGRTFVLGDDPVKLRLQADLPRIWAAGRAHFDARPGITGAELYARAVALAEEAGWEFGGPHSGHLVGEFRHEVIDGERIESYVAPGNTTAMRRTDRAGRREVAYGVHEGGVRACREPQRSPNASSR